MDFNKVHNVYFVGVGGIGMSALARYFVYLGKVVCGYDRNETKLTKKLVSEGIEIHYKDDVNLIPEIFNKDKKASIIVYTPAIQEDHAELNYLIDKGFKNIEKVAMAFDGKDALVSNKLIEIEDKNG